MSKPFITQSRVLPQWIDENGHMNVAYFVLAFDQATDAVYDSWGLGHDYPSVSGCSVFTLGMNVDYRSELFCDDPIRIDTELVDADSKRIHYFHRMYHGDTGVLAATNECLCMNIDLESRKAAAFPDNIRSTLSSALIDDADRPEGFGRTLSIRRNRD